VDIAIIGFPASGKTALFSALIGGAGQPDDGTREVSPVGVAKVPDPRLDALAELFHPDRVVPAELTYHDLPPAREETRQRAIGGQQLNLLQKTSALLLVVRAFHDPSVPHVLGDVNPRRDVEALLGDLALSDLVTLERRVERIQQELKRARVTERDALSKEQLLLERIKASLEREVPIREQEPGPTDARLLANYQFLTGKPLLLVFNIGEEQLPEALSFEAELAERYGRPKVGVAVVSAKLERELAQLDAEEEEEFRSSMGASDVSIDRVLRRTLEVLGMVTFFTVVSGEVKAWTVPAGTPALKAAGTIHSDMERGFIRAEAVSFQEMVRCGSMTEARCQGVLRLEGKEYVVRDGDVVTFLFNI